ncbi:uncharacterized protein [Dermacentor albipictus]|uniref:uncharacterized protein isoform X2 n=1 Tax=Dermacentor albipictus TaxID=60249 RepID=UPI0031FDEB01
MQPTPRSESAKLSPCKFQSPLLLALSERGVRMSVTIGGPFPGLYPGTFDRTHCSDSSSVNPKDLGYHSPIDRAPVQQPPRPYFIKLQEQEWPRLTGTPHGSVAYGLMSTDYGVPSQAYMWTYHEPRPESPQEPAIPRHEADSVNSKCYARMCRLAVAALALAKVGVPVAAVARSVGRSVRNDTATVKAGNLMLKGASAKGLESNVRPHTTSSPTSTTSAAAALGTRGNSTVTAPREAGHYKCCGGTGQFWKVGPSQWSSLLSSSWSSSWSSSSLSSSQSSSVVVVARYDRHHVADVGAHRLQGARRTAATRRRRPDAAEAAHSRDDFRTHADNGGRCCLCGLVDFAGTGRDGGGYQLRGSFQRREDRVRRHGQ